MEQAPSELAIRVRDLRKTFGAVTALDGVNFEVRTGEIFGLLGPDGAGKTTLIRVLCGLLPADAGEAAVAGQNVRADPESVKPRLGYLAQRFALYGDLTVQENARFAAQLFGVPRADYDQRMAHLLRITGLEPFVGRLADALSGGMRQKLGLICTLLHRPQVLFLDEPTTGVDPASRRDFWRLLSGLPEEGVTVLVSTPYMDEAERCDRVALLHRGRLLACAAPEDLKTRVQGDLFSIAATPQPEARRCLEAIPAALSVTVYGDRLHVEARRGTDLDALVGPLCEAGLQVAFAESVALGLEDVFTTAVREEAEPRA